MPTDDRPIHFHPLTDADLPRLHAWINRPHVAAWWDAPGSLEDVIGEYGTASLEAAGVQAFLAYRDTQPNGLIQAYVALNVGDGWWIDETDPGVRGIDQFLADASTLNQGLGTAMVRAFVAALFADPTVTRIQTDPTPSNARAIRCYEKVGFRRVGEIDTPDGVALYMVCDRAAWLSSLVPRNAAV